MGHWNHRVVRRKIEGQPDYYGIYEAYYSSGGYGISITTEPVSIHVSDYDTRKEI